LKKNGGPEAFSGGFEFKIPKRKMTMAKEKKQKNSEHPVVVVPENSQDKTDLFQIKTASDCPVQEFVCRKEYSELFNSLWNWKPASGSCQ